MKLYILRPCTTIEGKSPWEPWYDKCFGMVVRAENSSEARQIASDNANEEEPIAWYSSLYSTCEELSPVGPSKLIMKDSHDA